MLAIEGNALRLGAPPPHWRSRIVTRTSRIAWAGYAAVAVLVLGFGVWAATAPISGAVVAPGVVAAAGQNILVQHLEGGIISEIKVREGEPVVAGEPVLVLDPTLTQSQLNRIVKQIVLKRVVVARLEAERDGADSISVPERMGVMPQDEFDDVVRQQQNEFKASLSRYQAELAILDQRASVSEEARIGLQAQKKAAEDQLAIVRDEADRKEKLLADGLTNRSEYTALLRSEADLIGQVGALESQIATTRSQQIEAREQIERAKSDRVQRAISQLNDVRASLVDLEEQMSANQSILERTVIRAPTDGIVVRMVYNSPGSVVRPGEMVMELLPTTKKLIVQASVNPADIDLLQIGQEADLRFSALNMRVTPTVKGRLIYVSADRLVDQATQHPYYTARLEITDNLPPEIPRERIYPGMPVETFLSTGDRTFIDYLLRPILDSFHRAFREE